MLNMKHFQRRPSLSPTTSSSTSSTQDSEPCTVCGDVPYSSRYGSLACLGCCAFFRRIVSSGKHLKCGRVATCKIDFESRNDCKSCRLQKCLEVGMNPRAVRFRDKIGPRRPKSLEAVNSNTFGKTIVDIDFLLDLQRNQRIQHQYSSQNYEIGNFDVLKIKQKPYRRANTFDISIALKFGFQNAIDWANQFREYCNLDSQDKKYVISEFGIAFTLIDQAFKTAYEGDNGFWLLQNETFLHSDYFLKISWEDAQRAGVNEQAGIHYNFVNELFNELSIPFRSLEVDKVECAILKTLLLLSPSFPGEVKLQNSEASHKNCLAELMKYSINKFPENGPERFGEIILLIRNIRCAVKNFYNQTRISDLFNVVNFDSFVINNMLS